MTSFEMATFICFLHIYCIVACDVIFSQKRNISATNCRAEYIWRPLMPLDTWYGCRMFPLSYLRSNVIRLFFANISVSMGPMMLKLEHKFFFSCAPVYDIARWRKNKSLGPPLFTDLFSLPGVWLRQVSCWISKSSHRRQLRKKLNDQSAKGKSWQPLPGF